MNYDAASFFTALFWWGIANLVFGMFVFWAISTNNQEVSGWVQFHIPAIYTLMHSGFVCPNGYTCTTK